MTYSRDREKLTEFLYGQEGLRERVMRKVLAEHYAVQDLGRVALSEFCLEREASDHKVIAEVQAGADFNRYILDWRGRRRSNHVSERLAVFAEEAIDEFSQNPTSYNLGVVIKPKFFKLGSRPYSAELFMPSNPDYMFAARQENWRSVHTSETNRNSSSVHDLFWGEVVDFVTEKLVEVELLEEQVLES